MGDAEQDPAQFDPRQAAAVADAYPDIVVGIKTAHYWTRQAWDAAVEAGERAGRVPGHGHALAGGDLPQYGDPGPRHPAARPGQPVGGAEADVAVLRVLDGPRSYIDCGRARFDGRGEVVCVMTLRAGRIVWDPGGRSMPGWEAAPAPYWEIPSPQA